MLSEKNLCPVCNGKLDYDITGRPMASICRKCVDRLLKEHKNDKLSNCPFCGSADLKHYLSTPYYYGAEGVKVHCNQCGANGGWGRIKKHIDPSLSVPPIFDEETVQNGFTEANDKWNRRS